MEDTQHTCTGVCVHMNKRRHKYIHIYVHTHTPPFKKSEKFKTNKIIVHHAEGNMWKLVVHTLHTRKQSLERPHYKHQATSSRVSCPSQIAQLAGDWVFKRMSLWLAFNGIWDSKSSIDGGTLRHQPTAEAQRTRFTWVFLCGWLWEAQEEMRLLTITKERILCVWIQVTGTLEVLK